MDKRKRYFVFSSLAISFLAICGKGFGALGSVRNGKGISMKRINEEELELIRNPLSRPAYFMKNGIKPEVLEIRDRVFFEQDRFDDQKLENIVFDNCIFDGFLGFRNDLINVNFQECQFFGGTFTGKYWQEVRFLKCNAEGPFDIGSGSGSIIFEDCNLKGITPKEMGYGNEIEHYGAARSEESTQFLRCNLTRVITSGQKRLCLTDCKIDSLYANTQSQYGQLIIESCMSRGGKLKFGGDGNNYSRINIRDSQLNLVDMSSVSSELVEISNSSLSLEMGGFEAYFKNIDIKSTKFHTRGLSCVLSNIHSITLENCSFDGASKGLQLNGKPNPRSPSPGRGPIYWGTVRNLAIRNTVVPKAKLGYMQFGELTLEKSTLADADLSHSTIGTLRFKEAKLDGALDLSNTTIRQVDNQGLSNTAQVTGRLESNPAGPAPDLSRLNKLQPGSNGKR